jgi:hypothetical protein
VPQVPGRFDDLALGILLTDLPSDRDSSLQVSLLAGENAFLEMDGKLKATIPIAASSGGFARIAYKIRNLVLPKFDAYRFVFYFDGSDEIVHYAPFVVLPLFPKGADLPVWARPKPLRH